MRYSTSEEDKETQRMRARDALRRTTIRSYDSPTVMRDRPRVDETRDAERARLRDAALVGLSAGFCGGVVWSGIMFLSLLWWT